MQLPSGHGHLSSREIIKFLCLHSVKSVQSVDLLLHLPTECPDTIRIVAMCERRLGQPISDFTSAIQDCTPGVHCPALFGGGRPPVTTERAPPTE